MERKLLVKKVNEIELSTEMKERIIKNCYIEREENKLDDKYLVFDKVIKISNYDEDNIKLTFSKKENGEFVEYLDLIKERRN